MEVPRIRLALADSHPVIPSAQVVVIPLTQVVIPLAQGRAILLAALVKATRLVVTTPSVPPRNRTRLILAMPLEVSLRRQEMLLVSSRGIRLAATTLMDLWGPMRLAAQDGMLLQRPLING